MIAPLSFEIIKEESCTPTEMCPNNANGTGLTLRHDLWFLLDLKETFVSCGCEICITKHYKIYPEYREYQVYRLNRNVNSYEG